MERTGIGWSVDVDQLNPGAPLTRSLPKILHCNRERVAGDCAWQRMYRHGALLSGPLMQQTTAGCLLQASTLIAQICQRLSQCCSYFRSQALIVAFAGHSQPSAEPGWSCMHKCQTLLGIVTPLVVSVLHGCHMCGRVLMLMLAVVLRPSCQP